MSYKRPASIALLSRSSYTRRVNRKIDCSPYMFGSCRRDFFSKNEPTKPKNFYNTPFTEKKQAEFTWKRGLMVLAAHLNSLTRRTIKTILLQAGFSEEEIEKLTVAQLTFCLNCRRINQIGNKKKVLERCLMLYFWTFRKRSTVSPMSACF